MNDFYSFSTYYEKVGFFVPTCFADKRFSYYEYTGPGRYDYKFAGHRTIEFVENLFRLGMLATESTRKPVENGPALSVVGRASEVFDAPVKMLNPRKILVEWMVPQEGVLYGRSWASRFFPEGISPATLYTFGSPFKTGRTVEVPQ